MIVILSQNELEITTETVMDWIWYLGGSCKRINGDSIDKITIAHNISNESDELQFDLNVKDVKVIWYWRWQVFNTFHQPLIEASMFGKNQASNLKKYLWEEKKKLNSIYFSLLNKINWIPTQENVKVNKIEVLKKAKKIGLRIPNTIITNSKKELLKFFYTCNTKIITKPLYEVPNFNTETHMYKALTSRILLSDIDNLEDIFYASLFQEEIEKEIELRVFFWDNKFYSMAIFSQLDPQTNLDFRNYNHDKPNRNVPYELETETQRKLLNLFKLLKLETGSVDMLIDRNNNEYVFLEINPVGQFGMISYPCNYYLEKVVANYLISIDS